jgi:hypothetical protein
MRITLSTISIIHQHGNRLVAVGWAQTTRIGGNTCTEKSMLCCFAAASVNAPWAASALSEIAVYTPNAQGADACLRWLQGEAT